MAKQLTDSYRIAVFFVLAELGLKLREANFKDDLFTIFK